MMIDSEDGLTLRKLEPVALCKTSVIEKMSNHRLSISRYVWVRTSKIMGTGSQVFRVWGERVGLSSCYIASGREGGRGRQHGWKLGGSSSERSVNDRTFFCLFNSYEDGLELPKWRSRALHIHIITLVRLQWVICQFLCIHSFPEVLAVGHMPLSLYSHLLRGWISAVHGLFYHQISPLTRNHSSGRVNTSIYSPFDHRFAPLAPNNTSRTMNYSIDSRCDHRFSPEQWIPA